MNIERISSIARIIKGLATMRDKMIVIGSDPGYLVFSWAEGGKAIMLQARDAAMAAGNAVYEKLMPIEIARLEAELKGEICPRAGDEEERFLAPVIAALGPHQGLNASWATMAWKIRGASDTVWLLDDESPDETVSLVARQDGGSGDPVISEIMSGPVSVVLPIAVSLLERK